MIEVGYGIENSNNYSPNCRFGRDLGQFRVTGVDGE